MAGRVSRTSVPVLSSHARGATRTAYPPGKPCRRFLWSTVGYRAAVNGPQFIPLEVPSLPVYIPPELCTTVGIDPKLPDAPTICMNVVQSDVTDSGISARGVSPDVQAGLRQVVDQARSEGIDLNVVVVDANPPNETPLRDIATEVGAANPGATVLALSPSFAGTYSPQFDRVTLEAGQDLARTGDPVQSTKNFLGELTTPHFPWTPFTIVLVIALVLGVVAARLLQVRGKRATRSDAASTSVD